MQPKAKLLIK